MAELAFPEPGLDAAKAVRGSLDTRPRCHRFSDPLVDADVFAHSST
jgi:hypothetical protein